MTQETEEKGIPKIFREECQLIGRDGNIFALLGIAKKHLKDQGRQWEKDDKLVDLQEEPKEYFNKKAEEMEGRVYESGNYDRALGIIAEYVVVV